MKKVILALVIFASVISACKSKDESSNNSKDDSVTVQNDSKPENNSNSNDPTNEVSDKIDPFKDFPKDVITANPGDIVLTPSVNWQRDATTQGTDKVNFIFYNQTIAEVGQEYSKVDFMSEKGVEIPNYMIIPIKPNQTCKKGDILLTWWQSGSGMKRAIVVDASNPKEPVVNYIDIDWDNPAKNKDGVGIGQMEEKLKPNTFNVLTNLWEPGTNVAAKDGGKYKFATIVKVSGEKVLTIGFAGFMKVYPKSDCTPIPNKINIKVGDAVQAPWVGAYINTKVEKIDNRYGRVFCDDPYSDKPLVVPFGSVITGLDIK